MTSETLYIIKTVVFFSLSVFNQKIFYANKSFGISCFFFIFTFLPKLNHPASLTLIILIVYSCSTLVFVHNKAVVTIIIIIIISFFIFANNNISTRGIHIMNDVE